MKFWGSIGFAITLFVLWIAMPKVFHALEDTLLTLLDSVQMVFQQAQHVLASPNAALAVPSVSY